MKIPNKINNEIKEYCKINNISDVDAFIIEKISTGFNIEKYGNAPFIKEVIVEKEVPIETIKEVIVEKIITKEVKDTHLIEELEKLKLELVEAKTLINEQNNKIKEQDDVLEHFKNVTVNRRTKYMKTSNLDDRYLD